MLSRWDAQGAWRASGAKTGAAWLAWKQRVPIQVARQRLRHARAMRTLPAIEEAWAAGDIDRAHVTTLLGARTARTAEVFDADHERLLGLARTHGFVDFKRACDRWETIVDPDGAEQGADDDRGGSRGAPVPELRRDVVRHAPRSTRCPVRSSTRTLRMIERELFDADWAEAKARLGREPTVLDLRRTPAQRRADALVEMATRARTAPAGGRRPAPLFTVVVGLETLRRPDPRAVQPHRAHPRHRRCAPHRGRRRAHRVRRTAPGCSTSAPQRRFFTGALRRAIEVRDRTCFHPSCDEVPERPEVDHIHEASKGGETTQDNGQLGCGFHNRWRNQHPDADDDPPAGSDGGR